MSENVGRLADLNMRLSEAVMCAKDAPETVFTVCTDTMCFTPVVNNGKDHFVATTKYRDEVRLRDPEQNPVALILNEPKLTNAALRSAALDEMDAVYLAFSERAGFGQDEILEGWPDYRSMPPEELQEHASLLVSAQIELARLQRED